MKFFLDSADIEEIKELNQYGIIDGVTTNPTLIAKYNKGGEVLEDVKNICSIVEGPVSIEVASNNYSDMLAEGNKILSLKRENLVLKLPMTWDGIKLCKHFSSMDKKVNMTLCFSANQALIAAKAGASYVSPFIGRLEDINQDGLQLIQDIIAVYSNYPELKTELLAASIRTPFHVLEAAKLGADIATVSGKVLKNLMRHPLTEEGIEIFQQDWESSKLRI